MVESGKNIFQSYFLKIWGGGGRVSRHPRYGKAEVLTLGNLYVNELVTCDFKSSSPVTVSLL